MGLRDPEAGCQSQSRTQWIVVTVQPDQRLRDVVPFLRRDALAVVRHPKFNAVGNSCCRDQDSRRDARAAVGHGVVDEVLQEYAQLSGVGLKGEICNLDFRPGVLEARRQILFNVLDHSPE